MNKKVKVTDTGMGPVENISIHKIVKQGSNCEPIMHCTKMSKVNNIRDTLQYSYRKLILECQFIGMIQKQLEK